MLVKTAHRSVQTSPGQSYKDLCKSSPKKAREAGLRQKRQTLPILPPDTHTSSNALPLASALSLPHSEWPQGRDKDKKYGCGR